MKGEPIYIPVGVAFRGPIARAVRRSKGGMARVPLHLMEEVEREIAKHRVRVALSSYRGNAAVLLQEMISEFE